MWHRVYIHIYMLYGGRGKKARREKVKGRAEESKGSVLVNNQAIPLDEFLLERDQGGVFAD